MFMIDFFGEIFFENRMFSRLLFFFFGLSGWVNGHGVKFTLLARNFLYFRVVVILIQNLAYLIQFSFIELLVFPLNVREYIKQNIFFRLKHRIEFIFKIASRARPLSQPAM